MRILFFHGLESPPVSDKTDYLTSKYTAFCPVMDYTDPKIFEKTLELVKEHNPDVLIGSSMGGYMAYAISSQTGIPCIIFNPALHNRTIDIEFTIGEKSFNSLIILGKYDTLIRPEYTIKQLANQINEIEGKFVIVSDDFSHRIPIDIFKKYTSSFVLKTLNTI